MTDLLEKKIVLADLKKQLEDGDQRTLARRMDTYPARISDALNGFVRNMGFLNGLETEIRKLLKEREAVKI